MAPHLLIVAAFPALLGSLLLLTFIAPKAVLIQQSLVCVATISAALLSVRYMRTRTGTTGSPWLLVVLACLLWIPLVASSTPSPHRWIGIFGFRLYIAPVVLPVFVLVRSRSLHGGAATAGISMVATGAVVLGLFVQPDAAQLIAFAISSIPILAASKTSRFVKLPVLGAIVLAAAASWAFPDPLTPVPYVEGVFRVAAAYSSWLLFLAILSAVLPLIALFYLAYRFQSPSALAVGLYLAVLYMVAPLQVTPVPLLGFGAGPMIGYFLMASQAWRLRTNAA